MSFMQIFQSKMADGTGRLGTGAKGKTTQTEKHIHYLYCLRYNDIFKKNTRDLHTQHTSCILIYGFLTYEY